MAENKVIKEPEIPILHHFQFAVINAVLALGVGAVPAEISRRLSTEKDRNVSTAQVFIALQRLEGQNLVGHVGVTPAPACDKRRKKIYHVKPEGVQAVEKTRAFFSSDFK